MTAKGARDVSETENLNWKKTERGSDRKRH